MACYKKWKSVNCTCSFSIFSQFGNGAQTFLFCWPIHPCPPLLTAAPPRTEIPQHPLHTVMSTSSLCSNTSSKMCTFVWRSWGWQVILITFRCCLTFTFSFCCRWSVLLSLLLLFPLLSATWLVTTGATFLLDKVFSYITLSSAKLSNRVLSSDILSGVLLLVLVHVNSGGGAGGAGSGCN